MPEPKPAGASDANRLRQLTVIGRAAQAPDPVAALEQETRGMPDDDRDKLFYELAGHLTKTWNLGEAERAAQAISTWASEKTWRLGEIAARWAQLGKRRRAQRLLREALGVARALDPGRFAAWKQAEALAKIAMRLAEAGEKDRAGDVLREARDVAFAVPRENVQGWLDAQSVLGEVAEELALLGQFDEARQTVQAIANDFRRAGKAAQVEKLIALMAGEDDPPVP